jgi:hypothetical protein
VRNLQAYLHPDSEHWLDWFHITMRDYRAGRKYLPFAFSRAAMMLSRSRRLSSDSVKITGSGLKLEGTSSTEPRDFSLRDAGSRNLTPCLRRNDSAFNDILQLTDVAGPIVSQ